MTVAWCQRQTSPGTSQYSNERVQEGNPTIGQTLGTIDEAHMLVENLPRKSNPSRSQDINCFYIERWVKN
jgi:hypothetical protein